MASKVNVKIKYEFEHGFPILYYNFILQFDCCSKATRLPALQGKPGHKTVKVYAIFVGYK